jgi:hypothetical protein
MGLIQKLRTSKRFGLFKPNYETKNLFLAQTCLPAGRWKGKSSPFFLARFGMTAGFSSKKNYKRHFN